MNNIRHWYDGKFYEWFIAPNQKAIFERMRAMIPHSSSILDIATGTGMFAFWLSDHARIITGIDLSKANIKIAQKKLGKSNLNNINFIHGNALELDSIIDQKYDNATISFAIHEMPPEIRVTVLEKMRKAANELIIADYISPMPRSPYGIAVRIIEFFAGKKHFEGYKSYQREGGLPNLLKNANLKATESYKAHLNTSIIIKAK